MAIEGVSPSPSSSSNDKSVSNKSTSTDSPKGTTRSGVRVSHSSFSLPTFGVTAGFLLSAAVFSAQSIQDVTAEISPLGNSTVTAGLSAVGVGVALGGTSLGLFAATSCMIAAWKLGQCISSWRNRLPPLDEESVPVYSTVNEQAENSLTAAHPYVLSVATHPAPQEASINLSSDEPSVKHKPKAQHKHTTLLQLLQGEPLIEERGNEAEPLIKFKNDETANLINYGTRDNSAATPYFLGETDV